MDENFKVFPFASRSESRGKRVWRDGIVEPAEAVDYAEQWLGNYGTPGKSFCEIVFNGDGEVHTTVYLLDENQLGILNSENAKWPVFYLDQGPQGNLMLEGDPWPDQEAPADEGRHKADEDAPKMDLGEEDDEDEFEDAWDDSDEDDEDESPEDDEGDDSEDESDEDESENGDDETDEDEGGTSESDDGENESESEQEETEMPRLKIFAKMKGPLGWRKRAEAEDLNDRNTFSFKIGVLDPDEEKTPAKREAEVVVHVDFTEREDERGFGRMRLKLPTLDLDNENLSEYFTVSANGIITVAIPYKQDDAE